ncbi:MAG: family 10 glycosylhydrolase, partial [Clostridia bacterium]|nr:family 10 glycosylhydrolase [Clostridia bacterium]
EGGAKSLADWRREQLNLLVRGLYDATKSVNEGLLFGISPAGNFNTVYNNQYADVYTWCGEAGYIDYICPQAYFGMEHGSFDFVKVSTTFQDMIKTDSVKLIVGMSLGKAKDAYTGGEDKWAGAGKTEWIEHQDVIKRELEATKTFDKCTGVAFFCYQYFFHPVTGEEVIETQAERDNFLPLLKSITWKE